MKKPHNKFAKPRAALKIRMRKDLLGQLKKCAAKHGRSVNAEMTRRLEESVIQDARPGGVTR